MQQSEDKIIEQTVHWIKDVVIGCNFCPFAAKTLIKQSIHFLVIDELCETDILHAVAKSIIQLDNDPEIETTLIIFANDNSSFADYLQILNKAEKFLDRNGYSGIYQMASFHPDYIFSGSDDNDPANYTNRSPYPMLHLLREESITIALENFPDPESIPEKNVLFAREKGLLFMQKLREKCFN